MAWFRSKFCDPPESANLECTVPVFEDDKDADAWCTENYQSIACLSIREKAQDNMLRSIYAYYYANAAWAIVFVLLVSHFLSVLSRAVVKSLTHFL